MALRSLAVYFNSFFASCEQQERTELRGTPVGVIPVLAEMTCCIAASRQAKGRGVKVGTGVAKARALCPDIVIVQQRPALYIGYHRRLLAEIEVCIQFTAMIHPSASSGACSSGGSWHCGPSLRLLLT